MNKENKEMIFILGHHKCCTSSLVRVLNSSSNTHIQYEYFHKFSDFFENESHSIDNDIFRNYVKKINKINYKNNIKYIGDKVICTSFKKLVSFTEHLNKEGFKTIYPIVDVINWFAKTYSVCVKNNSSLKKLLNYENDLLSNAIVTYIKNFIYCFKYNNIIFVKNFETENLKEKFKQKLNIDILSNWYDVNDDKFTFKGHASSRHDFIKFDNEIKEKQCDFWDRVLKIFYKYYDNIEAKISNTEIFEDLNELDKINDKYSISEIKDLYSKLIIYTYSNSRNKEERNNFKNKKVNYLN